MNEVQGSPVAAMPPAGPVVPQFLGRRGALFTLVLKTMGLTLLTLGVYRFWAKTRLRRYFWGNVVIAGEPLEYTGKATELLIGFLIVVAVLVPLSVASTMLGVLSEGGPEWLGMSFNITYFLVLVFLIDFATYRMWRYRLTRTRWRGIRFGMENGALRYAGRAFLWRIGQVLTLGFITPWARLDLAKLRVSRMRLGDQAFALKGEVLPLLLRWLWVWGSAIAAALLVVALAMFKEWLNFVAMMEEVGLEPGELRFNFKFGEETAMLAVLVAVGSAFVVGLVAFAFYRISETRYFIRCASIGDVRLDSCLRARSILPAFVLAWGILLALFAAVLGVVVIPVAFGAAEAKLLVPVAGFAVAALMLVLSPLVTYPIAVFQTVRHVWATLSIHDIGALDGVLQAPKEEPRFGEGLADALDVGAI